MRSTRGQKDHGKCADYRKRKAYLSAEFNRTVVPLQPYTTMPTGGSSKDQYRNVHPRVLTHGFALNGEMATITLECNNDSVNRSDTSGVIECAATETVVTQAPRPMGPVGGIR